MLFSTNRIKELRLRIDTFELLTNQDFYIHLVKRKRFLSSFFTRPSGFSRARNPFPLALRTPATQANHDLARKIGKYKSDDITAAKFFTTPLLCSWQIKLQTTPWLYLHSTDPTKLKLQYYTTPPLPPYFIVSLLQIAWLYIQTYIHALLKTSPEGLFSANYKNEFKH